MQVYSTDKIKNVALFGHGGTGKTSLTEAMAFLSGVTTRMGNVTDGNTISDYDKEEQKRKFSIATSVVPIEWNGCKVNVLDTPGYFDFVGETQEAAAAADSALIVSNAKAGIQVGMEKAWKLCEDKKLPCAIVLTQMDNNSDVSFSDYIDSLQDTFGSKVVPLYVPFYEGGKFAGIADVVAQTAAKFGDKGKMTACDMPDSVADLVEHYREGLMETVAEASEEFMERYFGGDEFTEEEVRDTMKDSIADRSLVPVFCTAATATSGVSVLLDNIATVMPSPDNKICCKISGINTKTNEAVDMDYDPAKTKTAYVWKTISDPFIGKYSLIKVCSGTLKPEDSLYDVQKGSEQRLGKLYVIRGNKPQEVPELAAGDIGALTKLDISTGDSLATKAEPIEYPKAVLSTPYTYQRYRSVNKGDEDKIAQALARLAVEDLTFRTENDAANHQTLIYAIGDQQIEVIKSRLKERYKVDIELLEPKVAFRETIRKKSDVEGKHKKQSGGHGQYGHVKMRFEPSMDQTKPYEFAIEVVGGAVPKNYYPAVEKGLTECVLAGPVAAYPVVGVKAILYDGSYHPVDSSEQAFKTATRIAFKNGFLKADPILLEPIITLKVSVKDQFTGDVMGDLNKRRGRVLGMNPDPNHKGNTLVEAEIPQMEIYGYSTILRSMTGGSGDFSFEFCRYEQAPADVQAKQIAARAEEVKNQSEE